MLTSINNSMLAGDNTNYANSDATDLFGDEILCEKTDAGIGNTVFYNGNISAIKLLNNPLRKINRHPHAFLKLEQFL